MVCEEFKYDLRLQDEDSKNRITQQEELIFKLNHTMRFRMGIGYIAREDIKSYVRDRRRY